MCHMFRLNCPIIQDEQHGNSKKQFFSVSSVDWLKYELVLNDAAGLHQAAVPRPRNRQFAGYCTVHSAVRFLSRFSIFYFFFSMTQQFPVRLLIIEVSRSHSDTPHSVGLLWTSDQPVAETST